jgi:hypothetical protein
MHADFLYLMHMDFTYIKVMELPHYLCFFGAVLGTFSALDPTIRLIVLYVRY